MWKRCGTIYIKDHGDIQRPYVRRHLLQDAVPRAQPRSLEGPVQAPPERRSSPAGDASLHRRAARLSRRGLKVTTKREECRTKMPLSLFYTKCIPHRRTMCRTLLAWQGVRAKGKRGVSGDSSWKEQVSEEISGQEKAQARCANQKNIPTKTNRPRPVNENKFPLTVQQGFCKSACDVSRITSGYRTVGLCFSFCHVARAALLHEKQKVTIREA